MKIFNYTLYRENYHFSVNFYSVFLLVTFIPDIIGIKPSLITLPFWGLKLILGIWIIVKDPRSLIKMSFNEIIYVILVLVYLVNLYIDIFLTTSLDFRFFPSFSEGVTNYVVFCVNIVLAFSFRYHPSYHSNKSFYFFFITLTIGLILAFYFARISADSYTNNIRYSANSITNSIIYGQTAAALTLISIWAFLRVNKWKYRIFLIVTFLIGFISIAKTGSRAPVVVLVIVSAFYFMARFGNIKGVLIIGIIISVIFLFINPIIVILESMNSSIVLRLTRMIVDQDSSGRDQIYSNVFEIIKQNPVFGSYYLVPSGQAQGSSPHNFILEVFMTTGMIGGIIFLFLLINALIKSYRIIKINHSSGWIILLFLQIVVYGMFSTSLFGSQNFWILLFYVSSINLPGLRAELLISFLQNANYKNMIINRKKIEN